MCLVSMMFEITGDDIAAMTDEDLRTLVGRLCEAELRRRNLALSAVTWGGEQTAKDGGLDVRVALSSGTRVDGFIPKTDTGYQIKKPDMPRAAIIAEMKPKGVVRSVIVELAKASGAYIIVSSTGSTSDSALKSRRDAMAEALQDCPRGANLTLDFYDRNRIATWVRDHVDLIPWVLSRIGKSISGWRSFGSWSRSPDGADAAYLVDEAPRIRTGDKDEGDGLSATDGINKIRDVLRTPGRVVRLVGLSGVGKTRLVEALFDPTVGSNCLDSSLAIYTDVAEGPAPQPAGLASDLIGGRRRAILVIDNCAPEIHRQLSNIARSAGTTISVITVEYDIREDQPEGTDVFALDASSLSLIEKLISNRFPDLSYIGTHTIAEFSGGNARVALALAGTVQKNETVAELGDAELFRRLFQQRHDSDASLLSIAQACSLVYSFEGEKLCGDGAELPILGGLIGKSPEEVFSAIAELKRRDLLQDRGPWRAVLPQAIANRLAAMALQNIPASTLKTSLVDNASERLLQSFSRRLGYLDNSKEARAIVRSWLAPGGLLGDIPGLTEVGRAMLGNVAPVMPDAVLSALENTLVQADEATLGRCQHFIRLLRSLAYEAAHFERAVALLVKFGRLPSHDNADSEAANIVKSLFTIVLSGTLGPLELRLKVVEGLLRSSNAAERALGVEALATMLKTSDFSSTYNFDFGARWRDYGYQPKTAQEVRDWFGAVLKLAGSFALLESTVAEPVRKAIAHEFRGLWTNSGQADELERLSRAIGARQFWREGWIAARHTRIYDGERLPPEIVARLTALEEFLRPKDLVDKVRGVVIRSSSGVDLDDSDDVYVKDQDYAGAMARAAGAVENLGREVAADEEAFKALLPELMGGNGKLVGFGRGIALKAEKPREIWSAMVAQVAAMEKASVSLLCGFLGGLEKRDDALANTLLDDAVDDPTLAEWIPILQASVVIDEKGLARLHRALKHGRAPIAQFIDLAYGRTCDTIPGPEFKRLVLAIVQKPGGIPVALEILSMRLHSDHADKRKSAPEVVEAGKALLAAYKFGPKDGRATREDYALGVIVRASLAGNEGKLIARRLCRDLMAAVARYEVHTYDHIEVIKWLFEVHPTDVLDELFSGDAKSQRKSIRLLNDLLRFGKSPMDAVPDDIIIGWCDRDPKVRYSLVAAVALLSRRHNNTAPHEWTNLARQLLLKAPDAEAVFKEIVSRFFLMSGSGSFATELESRLRLLDQLDVGAIPPVANALDAAKAMLKQRIEAERCRETEEDRARSGRFE